MKKIACITLLGILLASCTTKKYYEVIEEVAPNFFYKDITVRQNQWVPYGDEVGDYYYYEVDEPRLTRDVINYAIMETYYMYKLSGLEETRYIPLSHSEFWGGEYLGIQEYFTVEYSVGLITLMYKSSDNAPEPPLLEEAYTFQSRFMW